MFESFQPLAAIAVTPTGANVLRPLIRPHIPLWVPEAIVATLSPTAGGGPEPEMAATIVTGPQVQWYPRILWVGVGCQRGTPQSVIALAVETALASQGLAAEAIAGIATIDLKADEAGLLAFCRDRDLPLVCFTGEQLRSVSVPNPSAIVAAEVETPSVAEAAALLAAEGVGPAIAPTHAPRLLVPKQIVRQPAQPGAVTVAIAQASGEYTG